VAPRSPPTMAVSANDIALRDLFEDPVPVVIRQPSSDVEALVAKVIELEHHRIGLSTVAAGVCFEVREQDLRALPKALPLLHRGSILVQITVLQIVRPPILGAAGAAMRSPRAATASPNELYDRPLSPTPAAPFGLDLHEQMFVHKVDRKRGSQGSNLEPSVLETDALPA
jgi:hypothetical protein